jgi:hypothetical protein
MIFGCGGGGGTAVTPPPTPVMRGIYQGPAYRGDTEVAFAYVACRDDNTVWVHMSHPVEADVPGAINGRIDGSRFEGMFIGGSKSESHAQGTLTQVKGYPVITIQYDVNLPPIEIRLHRESWNRVIRGGALSEASSANVDGRIVNERDFVLNFGRSLGGTYPAYRFVGALSDGGSLTGTLSIGDRQVPFHGRADVYVPGTIQFDLTWEGRERYVNIDF